MYDMSCRMRRACSHASVRYNNDAVAVLRPNQQDRLRECLQAEGKAGPYEWFTYKETEALVLDIASAMSEVGVSAHDKCSIYGANCAQWMIAMQVQDLFLFCPLGQPCC